jgi:hypothetical protein
MSVCDTFDERPRSVTMMASLTLAQFVIVWREIGKVKSFVLVSSDRYVANCHLLLL